MPRRRRSSSAPFQLQPAVEQRCDLPQSVNADAHRGKFDRQGNAVELAADLGKHVCVVIGHIGTMTGCSGAFHEQAYRGIAQRLAYAQPRSLRRPLQRDELENLLTLHQQRLSAGCKDADAGCPLVNVLCKSGDDLDNVLATVEDEKQAAIAQEADDAVRGIGVMHDKAQRRSDAYWRRASRLSADRDQENAHGRQTPSAYHGPARRRRSSCRSRRDL